MQFLSGSFMILWMIAFALYYLVPPKMQWYVLLAAGIIFYVAGTGGIPAALLLTAGLALGTPPMTFCSRLSR